MAAERLSGDLQRRQIDYWAAQLAGAPALLALLALLALPTDRPRPAEQSYRGATQPIALSRELAAGLRRLSQTLDATLFTTLLGGLAAVLSRYAGQHDLVIGVGNGQRPHPDLEDLIGCFTNTLAPRVRLASRRAHVSRAGGAGP